MNNKELRKKEDLKIEVHSTRGLYNGFRYLDNQIYFDVNKVFVAGGRQQMLMNKVKKKRKGGIIVLSAGFELKDSLESWITNKVQKDNIYDAFWAIGNFFHKDTSFKAVRPTVFNENSLCLEIYNIEDVNKLIDLAKELCVDFALESVAISPHSYNEIYFLYWQN